MASSPFPDHVEAFVNAVKFFVASFDLELRDSYDADATTAHSRAYELSNGNYKSSLVVHRTSRSIDSTVGEFRARALIELPEQVQSSMAGLEDIANQYASVGALVTFEGGNCVMCQCLIQQETSGTTAGIMAAALVHAAPSIIQSMGRAVGGPPDEKVTNLSAWSDLDFEQIHYDYAHLGIGRIASRRWSQTYLGGSTLTIDAVDNNPYWGGGLLILLQPEPEYFRTEQPPISTNELNTVAQLADDMPAFGGWCRRESEFWFVSFAPNFLKALPGFTDLTIETAVRRLRSTPVLVETVLATRKPSEGKG
ncbi:MULTISPECIES: hypothetical protein [unclassified Ensifer]|uniref:hypothetical protein n=1 Tax=unclassified Ensifer TaxID=2633371 RepID=UPI0007124849|nr:MULTISPECIES: hypothetical protein [unclassified Ensifer]KQX40911.1 hypothetical protein ASD49_15735 [Ensifer sp. Root1298]KQX70232.1 hypothetical protein ASD41_16810 [Ensifer sp. Root1312]KRC14472.1 hypothetical protein ASE29_17290 [Ensifer sp. Root74]KRD57010.1 hypothetical protein ASE71_10705 [Ensifer sp. Root954]